MEKDSISINEKADNNTTPAIESATLERRLNEAEEKVEQFRLAYLDAQSELDHASYRAKEDIAQVHKYAVERFARELLAIKDNLEMALTTQTEDTEAFRQGLELTCRQLEQAFLKFNLKEIHPAPGSRFDPFKHRIAAGAQSEVKNSCVIEVHEVGYQIEERVLRPALVTVDSHVQE